MTVAGQRDSSQPHGGYSDRPVVKEPVWTWEVPVYFFVGGIAGMSMLMAAVAHLQALQHGQQPATASLIASCIWIALVGVALSPALLISDLGRPRRFLNMVLRFNVRSPMSMGVWILVCFSGAVSVGLVAVLAAQGRLGGDEFALAFSPVLTTTLVVAGVLGGLLATYTGVLLGTTAIPAWNSNRLILPVQFGFSSLAGTASVLLLLGHEQDALVPLFWLSLAVLIVTDRLASVRTSLPSTPWWFTLIPVLMLLIPTLGLALDANRIAAVSFLVGGLLSRFAWLEKGRLSARSSGASWSDRERSGAQ